LTNGTDTNRTAATSTLETAKPMETDDNSVAEEREGNQGQEEQEVLTDGAGTDEEDSGSRESPAPSDLARSLREHRPALQRIRRRLHGHGNDGGITSRLVAMMLWISMQMTHTEAADPSLFLTVLGDGEGEGRNKGGRKAKRESLSSLQTPRYRQGPLNLTGEEGGQEEEGRGDEEGGAEGERRGQATPRTSRGTVTGGSGSAVSREPKRKATSVRSELSTPQTAGWRQLTLKFGGMGGEGREGGESREEGEGASRGQARRKTQPEPSMERRTTAPPGADRSDGQGPPSGLV
jgi:hypothetical protein